MENIGVFKTKEDAVEAVRDLYPGGKTVIRWLEGDVDSYHYGKNCFYCGGPASHYLVTELSDGSLIGNLVCDSHARQFSEVSK